MKLNKGKYSSPLNTMEVRGAKAPEVKNVCITSDYRVGSRTPCEYQTQECPRSFHKMMQNNAHNSLLYSYSSADMNLRFPSSTQTRIFLELSNSESMVEMLPIPEYLYIFFWLRCLSRNHTSTRQLIYHSTGLKSIFSIFSHS